MKRDTDNKLGGVKKKRKFKPGNARKKFSFEKSKAPGKGVETKVEVEEEVPPWKRLLVSKGKPVFEPQPLPEKVVQKYTKGDGVNTKTLSKYASEAFKKRTATREQKIQWSEDVAARAELLLTEQSGLLRADEGEVTKRLTQKQIVANVDITSATKHFELDLDFGPYRVDYTKNGRHLLIGGRRGHIGAFDWVTKRLHCEINVMEEIKDVQWLHIETMFAVAQKNWVHIYDNQGVELHCLKQMKNVLRMTFLPYHFLLVSSSEDSKLCWLDVSIGEIIGTSKVKSGRLGVMTHNPYNGVVCLGHQNGVVSMWSPNKPEPLVKMLCHKAPVETVSIDHTGTYMATSSTNNELRLWDIRKLEGPLQKFELRGTPVDTSFSQKGGLSLAFKNVAEVYKDFNKVNKKKAYLIHESLGMVENIEFCPYEDVLGIGTKTGFTSILVPGSGEPNFDALEANPMQAKSQRREAEVKSLLEKVQPEMIILEPKELLEVSVPSLKDRIQARVDLLHMQPPQIDFTPRNKRRGNTARKARVKKIVKQDLKRSAANQLADAKNRIIEEAREEAGGSDGSELKKQKPFGALDRFLTKKNAKSPQSQPSNRGVK